MYELAKELGIDTSVLLRIITDMGEFVRSASSTVEPPVERRLKEYVAEHGGGIRRGQPVPKPSPDLFRRPSTGPVRRPPPLVPAGSAPIAPAISHAKDQVAPPIPRAGWHAGAVPTPTDRALLSWIADVGRHFPESVVHLDALRRLGSQFVYVGKSVRGIRPVRVRFSGAIEAAFGFTREVLFIYAPYRDLQTKSIEVGRKIIDEQKSLVTPDVVFVSAPDPRLKAKLDDWSTPNLLLIPLIPEIQDDPLALVGLLRDYIYSRDLFYVTTPVQGSRFFGRRTLLQELRDDIRQGRVAGIYGLRKAGKTSVLMELSGTAEEGVVPILVDLEAFPAPPDDATDDILESITRRLAAALDERGLPAPELKMAGQPTIVQWKQQIQDVLKRIEPSGTRVLLLLDEVEYLTSDKVDVEEGDLPRIAQMLGAFRSLVQESSNFTFLLSGLTSAITENGRLYGRPNPLFSWAKTYYIAPFTRAEADDLALTLGGKMGIHLDDAALAALYDGTGGHAYLYRSLASAAVEQIHPNASQRRIAVPDIQRAYLPWRGATSGHVREMLNHVQRYYKTESLLLEFVMDDLDVFTDLARSEPQAVRHLVSLGLIREVGHRYELNSLLELSR